MPTKTIRPQVLAESNASTAGLKEMMPAVDVCGFMVRVFEDNGMTEYGAFFASACLIKIRTHEADGTPFSPYFIRDTIVHEFIHALVNYSGYGIRMRAALKMTPEQWDEFEENELCSAFAPLVASLFVSGTIVFPRLPGSPRHRRR